MQLSAGDSQLETGNSREEYDSVQDPKISVDIPVQDQSQLPGSQQKVMVQDGVEYKTTKDRYVGDIDPVTKLREGQGCYTYTNPFFQY